MITNRQGFSHRHADAKSLLDELLRRGMGGAAVANRGGGVVERAVDGNGLAVPVRNGVDERETAAIDGLFPCGDQAAEACGRRATALGVACGLFLVNRGRS